MRVVTTARPAPVRRAEHSFRTSQAILDAAVGSLAEDGWAGFTIAMTARRMGKSIRPIRNRVRNRDELAAFTWSERLRPPLMDALMDLGSAVSSRDPARIAKEFDRFRSPDSQSAALAEALIVSRHESALRSAVDASLGAFIRSQVTPSHAVAPALAARHSYSIQLALGLLLAARYPRVQGNIAPALDEAAVALCADAQQMELPIRPAIHMDVFPDMAPEDPVLEEVLRATLTLISKRGYEAATVQDIATSVGVTEGFIFGRYASKRELLADSLRRQQTAGWKLNSDYLEALARDFQPGIAAAILMREVLAPGRDLGRDMTLELLRLSWHDEAMLGDAIRLMDESDPGGPDSAFTVDVAADFGTYLLPRLAPDAWKLPMDLVFIPMHEARSGRS